MSRTRMSGAVASGTTKRELLYLAVRSDEPHSAARRSGGRDKRAVFFSLLGGQQNSSSTQLWSCESSVQVAVARTFERTSSYC